MPTGEKTSSSLRELYNIGKLRYRKRSARLLVIERYVGTNGCVEKRDCWQCSTAKEGCLYKSDSGDRNHGWQFDPFLSECSCKVGGEGGLRSTQGMTRPLIGDCCSTRIILSQILTEIPWSRKEINPFFLHNYILHITTPIIAPFK